MSVLTSIVSVIVFVSRVGDTRLLQPSSPQVRPDDRDLGAELLLRSSESVAKSTEEILAVTKDDIPALEVSSEEDHRLAQLVPDDQAKKLRLLMDRQKEEFLKLALESERSLQTSRDKLEQAHKEVDEIKRQARPSGRSITDVYKDWKRNQKPK